MLVNRGRRAAFVIMVVGALTASVAACGGDPSASGPGGGGEGSDEDTVVIGHMQHLTGVSAGPYGIPFDKGFELGIEAVNASGELGDVELKVESQDVAGEVPAAVTAFNQYVRDGATILVSPNDTPISQAITPLAAESDVLYLTGAAAVEGEVDHTFNLSDVVTPQEAFGEYIAGEGFERAVVITESDNPAFTVISDAFKEGFEGAGGTVAGDIAIAAADSDFSSALTNAAELDPDLLYIAALSEQSGNVISQAARQSGLADVQMAGPSAWQKEVHEIAGDAAVGALFARNWAPSASGESEFETKYEEEYDELPDTYAAIGYETAWIVAAAVKAVLDAGDEVTGETLAAAIVDAASSDLVQEHGPILEFSFTPEGIPVYPGVTATFAEDGSIAAV